MDAFLIGLLMSFLASLVTKRTSAKEAAENSTEAEDKCTPSAAERYAR